MAYAADMSSFLHEGLIEVFRGRPSLAAELLSGPLQVPVPTFDQARLASSDLTDLTPTEFRADAVVTLENEGTTVLAVAVDVQLEIDARKRLAWPACVARLVADLNCPVALLVVSPHQAVADWSAAPVPLGPGSVLTPVALGPEQLPLITDLDTARDNPELTMLSALLHGSVTTTDHR